ncbi:DNA-binding protein [Streptomyces sp. NPDC058694]|uniref:DNA-binding protein n=1 Tax=Streptomyces sp. NPDC058694 TaxID=3346603 RepID=UPI00364D0946
MAGIGAADDGSRGAFLLDSTMPGAAPQGFDAFLRGWEAEFGGGFQMPSLCLATTGDFRVKGRFARVRDVAIGDLHGASALRTGGASCGVEDLVAMYAVRRGTWTLGAMRDRGEHTVPAGQFLLGRFGRQVPFETPPHTKLKILILPAAILGPLLGNRMLTGPAESAEMRLLTAHADMVHATVTDFGPAGALAAHSCLIELAKAVVTRRFDDGEPPAGSRARPGRKGPRRQPPHRPRALARDAGA